MLKFPTPPIHVNDRRGAEAVAEDFIPAPEVEETDEDRMARIATEDAGFVPEASRVPEAAPAEQQGFLSR